MASLHFVLWDRFTVGEDGTRYIFYGWIKREDEYKDFVVMEYFTPEHDTYDGFSFVTSSAKWSEEICRIVYGHVEDHEDCIRIEDHFQGENISRTMTAS